LTLRTGGEVLRRYDAYPYAQFGVQRGGVLRQPIGKCRGKPALPKHRKTTP